MNIADGFYVTQPTNAKATAERVVEAQDNHVRVVGGEKWFPADQFFSVNTLVRKED